uniref:THAP domain-containing protein 1 n=1 Tax=Salarias fasciatus TaxID=181472 RepID=A0A672I8Z0_SALFA
MPRRCIVPTCLNVECRPRGMMVNFHHFPARNPQRLRNWMTALHLDPNTLYHVIESLLICSDHFVKEDCIAKTEHRTGSKRHFLKDTAVPSVGLPQPQTENPEALVSKIRYSYYAMLLSLLKWIVNESCLLQLFQRCRMCGGIGSVEKVTRIGSKIKVTWSCLNNHTGDWVSNPNIRGTAQSNLVAAAAILFTGATNIQLLY